MKRRLSYPKRGTPVIIHWFDAHTDQSKAGDPKELMNTKCELLDIGFYVGQKGRFVTIAVEMDDDDDNYFRSPHHIPKVNITQIEVLPRAATGDKPTTTDSQRVRKAPAVGNSSGSDVREGPVRNDAALPT